MQTQSRDIYLPFEAEITQQRAESSEIFSLVFRFTDPQQQKNFIFTPGQFVMLYLFGVGEVPISIIPHPDRELEYMLTIRRVGRVTKGLSLLQAGDRVGIRGPFGRGWPLNAIEGKDVVIITGGSGCAASISIIQHILQHREHFGKLTILQGVKHSDDLLFRPQYERWSALPNTEVLLAADIHGQNWPWYSGLVTALIDQIDIIPENTLSMMCGPEAMMFNAIKRLKALHLPPDALYVNLERNMECAVGHCGHCMFGGKFICKDGPVFAYPEVKHLLGREGF